MRGASGHWKGLPGQRLVKLGISVEESLFGSMPDDASANPASSHAFYGSRIPVRAQSSNMDSTFVTPSRSLIALL